MYLDGFVFFCVRKSLELLFCVVKIGYLIECNILDILIDDVIFMVGKFLE